jgi:signal transduction histidine kinase
LEDALDHADEVMEEGRDTVMGLRASSADVVAALGNVGRSLAVDRAAVFHSTVQGRSRRLDPSVQEEVFRVGSEALTNAFKHAQAHNIHLEIRFESEELKMIVWDDGIGIPVPATGNTGNSGHFGLIGMRERAAGMKAQFDIRARDSGGTEVMLSVPDLSAFHSGRAGRSRMWIERLRTMLTRKAAQAFE